MKTTKRELLDHRGAPAPRVLRYDPDEVAHYKLALKNMLDAYHSVTDIIPERMAIHGFIVGRFQSSAEAARRLLAAKRKK